MRASGPAQSISNSWEFRTQGFHMDEPWPNPQPGSGVGQLVTQLSLKYPEQSKDKLGTTKFDKKTTGQC